MPVKNRIAEMHDEIAAWRRDFHEHPELLYDTRRTAAIVAAIVSFAFRSRNGLDVNRGRTGAMLD